MLAVVVVALGQAARKGGRQPARGVSVLDENSGGAHSACVGVGSVVVVVAKVVVC